MTSETFREAVRQFTSPGRRGPFAVELANGIRYVVPHPEVLRVNGDLIQYDGREQYVEFFDATSVIRVVGSLDPPGGILDAKWGDGTDLPE